jgi:hypothetical protein
VRTFYRLVLGAAFAVLLAIVVAAFAIQLEQHLFQRRAERLLEDIVSFQLHKSTYQDARTFLTYWKSSAEYGGACASEHCQGTVVLRDFFVQHLAMLLYKLNFMRGYLLIGGLPSEVRAWVTVTDGVIQGKAFMVAVQVPPYTDGEGAFGDYTLIGDATTVPELHGFNRSQTGLPLHPTYLIGKPGGCDGPCREVHVNFTADADPTDISRLMQFDLSCLTRLVHPCRKEWDIMPVAWAQYVRESAGQ